MTFLAYFAGTIVAGLVVEGIVHGIRRYHRH